MGGWPWVRDRDGSIEALNGSWRRGTGRWRNGLEGMEGKSVEEFVGEEEGRFSRIYRVVSGPRDIEGKVLPFGTSLISSHHMTGRFEYLLRLRKPMSISSRGASPQRSCFCWLRSEGLASTR